MFARPQKKKSARTLSILFPWQKRKKPSFQESSAVMCDGLIKQKDYLSVICMCIIYNLLLLLLKTSITLHISLIETAGSNWDSISWQRHSAAHTSHQQLQMQSQKLWQLVFAALNRWKWSWCCYDLSFALLPWSCQNVRETDSLPLHYSFGSKIPK